MPPFHSPKKTLFKTSFFFVCSKKQATESPEPVYDISECALKNVPPGVYSRCMIQRKEALLLQVRIRFIYEPCVFFSTNFSVSRRIPWSYELYGLFIR